MIGRQTTLLVWGLLGTAVVAGQVSALLSKCRLPGLGAVIRRLNAGYVGRSLFLLAWMWLGWHAFAR